MFFRIMKICPIDNIYKEQYFRLSYPRDNLLNIPSNELIYYQYYHAYSIVLNDLLIEGRFGTPFFIDQVCINFYSQKFFFNFASIISMCTLHAFYWMMLFLYTCALFLQTCYVCCGASLEINEQNSQVISISIMDVILYHHFVPWEFSIMLIIYKITFISKNTKIRFLLNCI